MEFSGSRASDPAVESLFRLLTTHLDCSSCVLTKHGSERVSEEILAICETYGGAPGRTSRTVSRSTYEAGKSNMRHEPDQPDEQLSELRPTDEPGDVIFSFGRDDGDGLSIAITWAHGDLQFEGRRRAHSVCEWVISYLRLLWHAEASRQRSSSLTKALDLFGFAIMLLDVRGRLLFENVEASLILDAGTVLRRAGETVTATDFKNAGRLKAAIQSSNDKKDPALSSHPGRRTILFLPQRAARPLVATLFHAYFPVQDHDVRILTVVNPEAAIPPTRKLARALGLTPAEGSLADYLLAGLTLSHAARTMNIGMQTARTYLKQIFSKTDTHRQAELVRLLLNSVVRMNPVLAEVPAPGGRRRQD